MWGGAYGLRVGCVLIDSVLYHPEWVVCLAVLALLGVADEAVALLNNGAKSQQASRLPFRFLLGGSYLLQKI